MMFAACLPLQAATKYSQVLIRLSTGHGPRSTAISDAISDIRTNSTTVMELNELNSLNGKN